MTANAWAWCHAVTWERRCVVSFIAVMDQASALVPAFRSPACSRFQAARQAGEQNRACSRRGTNGVPHCSQALVSATTVGLLRERLRGAAGRCYRAGQDPPRLAVPCLAWNRIPLTGISCGKRRGAVLCARHPALALPGAALLRLTASLARRSALVRLPVILVLSAIHLSFTLRSVDRRLGPIASAAMAGIRLNWRSMRRHEELGVCRG